MPTDDTSDSVSMVVVTKIANEEDVDPLELEPLQSTLDTDALEYLVGDNTQNLRVEFQYHGYEVTVESNDEVDVNQR